MTERQIQRAIIDAVHLTPQTWAVHVPNALPRARGASDAAMKAIQSALTRDGRSPGFPDLVVLWRGGCAFLEVKTVKGRTSDNQDDWADRLVSMGHNYALVRSVSDALAALKAFGAPVRTLS